MWSSSRLARKGLILLALSAALGLSGCTAFRPVYGDAGLVQQSIALSYGKPSSRLDQIVYQEFALRFGKANDPDAPLMTVSTSAATTGPTRTNVVKAATQQQVTVSATATVTTADGRRVFSGTRSATASYATVGQVLADTEAANEAQERAAREAAEGLRLAILGALGTAAPGQ